MCAVATTILPSPDPISSRRPLVLGRHLITFSICLGVAGTYGRQCFLIRNWNNLTGMNELHKIYYKYLKAGATNGKHTTLKPTAASPVCYKIPIHYVSDTLN